MSELGAGSGAGSPRGTRWASTRGERERAVARRQARYFEQVAAIAKLQAAGVSMDALRRGKRLIDAGRYTDWPDGAPEGMH